MPSTVTGGYDVTFPGLPTPVGATVAADGSIDVTQDGVSIISGTGLKFVINPWGIGTPSVYYAKTIWHGD